MYGTRHIGQPQRQNGAALLIMLIILVMGALTILVNTLNSSSVQITRNKVTAEALAQAKAALIGRAIADDTSPGSLPCPDITGDGSAASTVAGGGSCPSYIGRLPWRTLGLPDLRDGTGERLWYALSPNFRDYMNPANPAASHPVNSDNQGTLNISGTTTANNVVAIVFAPGLPLAGQSRSETQTAACATTGGSTTENLCATNYLEGSNANASPNSNYQTAATSSTFNDQMLYITHDQIFDPVEMRVARDVKNCLDNYAADSVNTYHRYPWAVPVSDSSYPSSYNGASTTGTYNTLFGRLSSIPNIDIPAPANAQSMANALQTLQSALDAYHASPTSSNQSNLYSAAYTVINQSDNFSGTLSNILDTAGDYGKYYASGSTSYATATGKVNNAISTLNSTYPTTDSSMPASWPASCTTLGDPTSYFWENSWNIQTFYQLSDGYKPSFSSGSSCVTGSTCLTITGSGNTAGGNGSYRAAVIVARQAISVGGTLQNRTGSLVYSDPATSYLEGGNRHYSSRTASTSPAISTAFETYKPSDSSYSTVNDLVLCVDGGVNCK